METFKFRTKWHCFFVNFFVVVVEKLIKSETVFIFHINAWCSACSVSSQGISQP